MSEYSNLMDDMYEIAEREGISQLDTAWLFINEVYWPNPHYHGKPVNHPEDSSGRSTNPPQPNPIEKYKDGDK